MEKKVGRNDPCPCGSGKKFKKCCEQTLIGKKFKAEKLGGSSLAGRAIQVTKSLSSFFQKKVEGSEKPDESVPNVEPPKTSSKD
jgi:hypothetical protein